jgi:hypothetical protein
VVDPLFVGLGLLVGLPVGLALYLYWLPVLQTR